MADDPPTDPPAAPAGRHIAYWRKPVKPGQQPRAPLAPLEPLGTWQIVGLIVVAVLVAGLVLMSAAWWVHAIGGG